MPSIGGLPLHPLVVHAVVVLLPLAALGTVLIAVRPAWRRAFGVPVLLVALVGMVAVPIATDSGQDLQRALPGPNRLIGIHQQRGDTLLPWAVAFVVVLAVAVLSGVRAERTARADVATRTRLTVVAAVLAAVLGIVVTGLVVWIGDSGATAVWKGVVG